MKSVGLTLFGYQQNYENCHPFMNFLKYLMINIRAYKRLYDGWEIYLAIDEITYEGFKKLFDYLYQEKIIKLEVFPLTDLTRCMLWRLNPNIYSDYLICRDIDALPTYRERQGVELWLKSGLDCHCFHDHIQHFDIHLMGGMSGYKKGLIDFELIEKSGLNYKIKGSDQVFLDKYIYPLVKNSIMEHNIKGMPRDINNPYSYDYIENIKLDMDDELIESNNLVSYIGQSGFLIPDCIKYWNKNGGKELVEKMCYVEKEYNLF